MTDIIEKLNGSLRNLKEQKCILKQEGPISFSANDDLLEYNINECFELILKFQNINLLINLSEMYTYVIEEKECKLFLDGGNIFTISRQ